MDIFLEYVIYPLIMPAMIYIAAIIGVKVIFK